MIVVIGHHRVFPSLYSMCTFLPSALCPSTLLAKVCYAGHRFRDGGNGTEGCRDNYLTLSAETIKGLTVLHNYLQYTVLTTYLLLSTMIVSHCR